MPEAGNPQKKTTNKLEATLKKEDGMLVSIQWKLALLATGSKAPRGLSVKPFPQSQKERQKRF